MSSEWGRGRGRRRGGEEGRRGEGVKKVGEGEGGKEAEGEGGKEAEGRDGGSRMITRVLISYTTQ